MLAVIMALSLVVVAGADDKSGNVTLQIRPEYTDETQAYGSNTLVYYVYLLPQDDATEIGAAQFTLTAPQGTTFESFEINEAYVYNDKSKSDDPTKPQPFGDFNGIFYIGTITSTNENATIGGSIENGTAFKAVLAGTDPSVGEDHRMLTKALSVEKGWLYKLTVKIDNGGTFAKGNSYIIGVGDVTAGYNGNDGGEITIRHKITPENKGYGVKRGDVDCNGTVDMSDLIYLAQYFAGWKACPIISEYAADVDKNNVVDMSDLIYLAQHFAGWKSCPLDD